MRRNPVIPFDALRIASFLKSRHVESASLLTGGACNSNYRVRLEGGEVFVVRFYSRGSPARDRRLLDLVRGIVPAPEICAAGQGWAVMPLMPGRLISCNAEAVRDAGRVLARIGSIRFDRPGRIRDDGIVEPWPFESAGGFISECLARPEVLRWLGHETARAVEHLLTRERTRLAEISNSACLVHGDYNPSNLLATGARITGVLDWEFAHSGTPYMDIGNLLRHLPECASELATGLSDEGVRLPEDWQYRAALVDLGSHLEFLTSAMPDRFKESCVARVHGLLARNE